MLSQRRNVGEGGPQQFQPGGTRMEALANVDRSEVEARSFPDRLIEWSGRMTAVYVPMFLTSTWITRQCNEEKNRNAGAGNTIGVPSIPRSMVSV